MPAPRRAARRLPALLLPALLVAAGPVASAELGVMPVTLQLDRLRDRGTVQVINLGTEDVTVQAGALAWQRQNGEDLHAPTQDLMLNPPIFTVPAGQTQVVRVGLRRGVEGDRETAYRLVLRELPPAPGTRLQLQAQVRVLMSVRLPVYVAPPQVRRDVRWTAQRQADGEVVAEVRNEGNVHTKVGALRLQDGSATAVVEAQPGAVLFPGEVQRFRLKGPTEVAGALKLEVQHEQGLQHVVVASLPQ